MVNKINLVFLMISEANVETTNFPFRRQKVNGAFL